MPVKLPAQPVNLARLPLRRGQVGPRVRAWQTLLVAKGFALHVDGSFGDKTYNATKAAQSWAGVTMDGVVGPVTWKAVVSKTCTKRPASVVRNIVLPRPKIIDARPGRNGFPNGPGEWGTRPASTIKAKLGHHTGGPGSFLADARFHTQSDYLTRGGAPALAYHLGIDFDGTLFVFNGWQWITWHCDGGKNTQTLGVVVRGNTDKGSLTAAQRKTLGWLWKQIEAGTFKPFKNENPWPRIIPSTTHRHVKGTSCPGGPGESLYRSLSRDFRTSL